MSQGLQIWDGEGRLQLDIGTRTIRVLTAQAVSTSNGSLSHPRLNTGAVVVGVATEQKNKTPAFSVTGDTLSWDWGDAAEAERATDLNITVMAY